MALYGWHIGSGSYQQAATYAASRVQYEPSLHRGPSAWGGALCRGLATAGMSEHAQFRRRISTAAGTKHLESAPLSLGNRLPCLDVANERLHSRKETHHYHSSEAPAADFHSLLWTAADQQQQAEATSRTLRQMVQTLLDAQHLLQGPISYLRGIGALSNSNGQLVPALQQELEAAKSRLVRALSAIGKLQTEHRNQQQIIHTLQQQVQGLQYIAESKETSAAAHPGGLLPHRLQAGLAVALAGTAGQQLHKQQLQAEKEVEQKPHDELAAQQHELQNLRDQVMKQETFLRETMSQQAITVAHLGNQLEEAQAQLCSSRSAHDVAVQQLRDSESKFAAQAQQLSSLSETVEDTRKAADQMRRQLLSREARLAALTQQLTDNQETAEQAAAAHLDQLQEKDVTINTLTEKVSLLEVASAAEAAWLQYRVQSSQQQAQKLQVKVQKPQDLSQQQPVPGVVQQTEPPAEITAKLRHALFGGLLEQLHDLIGTYEAELQQLRLQLRMAGASVDAADDSNNVSAASGIVLGSSPTPAGEEESAMVQQLQCLVANNTRLADQLMIVLAALSSQISDQAALLAARGRQLQEVDSNLQQQAALPTQALVAQIPSQQQQSQPVDDSLQQQQQQAWLERQDHQVDEISTALAAALQELQVAIADLQQEGAWAFPTSQGVIDLSTPDLVHQYRQIIKQELENHLDLQQTLASLHHPSNSLESGRNISHGSNPHMSSRAAADSFVEAYLQVKDRDKALHCVSLQLAAIQRQLSEWQDRAHAEPTITGGQEDAVAHNAGSEQQQVAMQRVLCKLNRLQDINVKMSEKLSISRDQTTAAQQEAAAACRRADALAAQLANTGQGAAAAEYALREQQLQQQLSGVRAELLSVEAQLHQVQDGADRQSAGQAATAAELKQQLEQATAAAAAEHEQLVQRLLLVEQSAAQAAADEQTAQAAKQHVQEQLAAAHALHTEQQHMLQQRLKAAAEEHAASIAALDTRYQVAMSEVAALKHQKQQQAAELRHAMVENQILKNSESSLQQLQPEVERSAAQAAADQQTALAANQHVQEQLAAAHALHTEQQHMLQQRLEAAAKEHAASIAALNTRYQVAMSEVAALKHQKQQQAAELRQAMVENQILKNSKSSLQQLQQQQKEQVDAPQQVYCSVQDVEERSSCSRDGAARLADQASGVHNNTINVTCYYDMNVSLHEQVQTTDAVAAATINTENMCHSGSKESTQSLSEYLNKEISRTDSTASAASCPNPLRAESKFDKAATNTAACLSPAALATAVIGVATASILNSSNGTELLGSGLSMALLVPLLAGLHSAQKAEAALQASKHKVCSVLGLLAATDTAVKERNKQAIALQQRMWGVGYWRVLLVQAWQLHEAEEHLAEELVQLQKTEEQQQLGVGCQQQDVEDYQQQQDAKSAVSCQGLAALVGLDRVSALKAKASWCKRKTGEVLVALAGRQSQLRRLESHVGRLAAVMMAGTSGEALNQLQQQMEAQMQQVERSRRSVQKIEQPCG